MTSIVEMWARSVSRSHINNIPFETKVNNLSVYHKHHKIPKHLGGSDDPSNLEEMTIEEHAEAHKLLWEQYHNEYDRVAWLGLSKMISKEAIRLILSEVGKRSMNRFTAEQRKKGGETSTRLYPERSSLGGKALWAKPGMKEHLSEKRKEQSRIGKNPMQGKKQKRVCCLCCKKEFAYNQFVVHFNKMSVDSVSTLN